MTGHKRASTIILCILLAAGFYLRSEFLWQTVVVPPAIRADARDYYMYAYNLYHHGVYSRDARTLSGPAVTASPDALRSPGYPLLLWFFMGDSSPNVIIARVFFCQVILSTLTVVVGFWVFRRFLTIYWAAAAAVLTAFSPHLIVMNIYLLTETLFCFLLVLAVWCAGRGSAAGWASAFGALIGAACLVRPGLQYFVVVAALFWLFKRGRIAKTQIIALAFGLAVVVSPWLARNKISVDSFSDDTLPILFLLHGAYPDFMYEGRPETYGFPYRFDPRAEEASQSKQAVLSEIMDRFHREPLAMTTWYLLKKPIMFWSWNIVAGQGDVFVYPVAQSPYSSDPLFMWSHRVMKWMHTPLVLLGMFGALIVWLPLTGNMNPRERGVARLISLLLIYYTVLHMIGAPFPRYSVPLRPFLYAMGAFGAAFIMDRLRRPKPLGRLTFEI